jgi:hypothetical protein
MPILELKTEEAIFRNDMTRDCHFMIDCSCGGVDGKYSGSHYKNASELARKYTASYEPRRKEDLLEHTFYLCQSLFTSILEDHEESGDESPLTIICNDCGREFPFTLRSYWDLHSEMMQEYDRRISELDDQRRE